MAESKVLKTISQETFDGVVRENIDDFEMSEQDALKDAVEQFKSQGVNINIIIKEVPQNGKHQVIVLVNTLSLALENEENWCSDLTLSTICNLEKEFSEDLSKRYQACKTTNITELVFRSVTVSSQKSCHLLESLRMYCALVNGQPDEANHEHMKFFVKSLKEAQSSNIAAILCTIFKHICTMQESNRQTLVKLGIIDSLMSTMEQYIDNTAVIRECCGALRALALDDDMRVEFGQSHETSKMMVNEHNGLSRFTKALKEQYSDPVVAKEISATLSKVMVRNEFCQEFIDLDGFDTLRKTVETHTSNMGVVKQCVNLLQAISRNDDVKIFVMKNGVVDMIMQILDKYIANPPVCESCFAALTTLALRNPSHCKIIADAKIAPIVIQAMKVHEKHAGVQKEACMLIRNLVARTREYAPLFLDIGVEELIRNARKQHAKVLDDQAKAALRDLDLDVDLTCLWMGANKGISN